MAFPQESEFSAMCRRAIASKEGVLASTSASRFTAKGLPPDFTRVRSSRDFCLAKAKDTAG